MLCFQEHGTWFLTDGSVGQGKGPKWSLGDHLTTKQTGKIEGPKKRTERTRGSKIREAPLG